MSLSKYSISYATVSEAPPSGMGLVILKRCNFFRCFLLFLVICCGAGAPISIALAAESAVSAIGTEAAKTTTGKTTTGKTTTGKTTTGTASVAASGSSMDSEASQTELKKSLPKAKANLYFACERKLALRGKRIKASDWLGRTSAELSYGDRAADCDSVYSEEKLFERISNEINSTGQPLTLFIHGCCVSFSEDLIQANDIQQALQSAGLNGPLLAYDWATPCYNYAGSLAKLPGCRSKFTSFLERLVAKIGRDKIVIVAHSLGIHALQNYCRQALETEPKATQVFSAVILSRPDVDFSSFKSSEAALKNFSGKLMLLCARNDINLKLSSFIRRAGYNFVEDPRPVHDNYMRLGQASVASGVADRLAVYDISQLRLRHLIPYKLIADLLTGETSSYLIERANGGVLEVKTRM